MPVVRGEGYILRNGRCELAEPGSAMSREPMPFVDLKSQYAALKSSIDARMQRVLDHGQYILGPEVDELEESLAARVRRAALHHRGQRHRGAADRLDGARPAAGRRGDHHALHLRGHRPR